MHSVVRIGIAHLIIRKPRLQRAVDTLNTAKQEKNNHAP
jgi:hypothetical protein